MPNGTPKLTYACEGLKDCAQFPCLNLCPMLSLIERKSQCSNAKCVCLYNDAASNLVTLVSNLGLGFSARTMAYPASSIGALVGEPNIGDDHVTDAFVVGET